MRRRYVASKRHTIQVDGPPYMRQLALERRNRVDRAERGRVQRPARAAAGMKTTSNERETHG